MGQESVNDSEQTCREAVPKMCFPENLSEVPSSHIRGSSQGSLSDHVIMCPKQLS